MDHLISLKRGATPANDEDVTKGLVKTSSSTPRDAIRTTIELTTNVPNRWKHIAASMKDEVVECSFKRFMEHYSPWQPKKKELREAEEKLIEEGWCEIEDGRLAWTERLNVNGRDENNYFKDLETISRELEKITVPERSATLRLIHKPTNRANPEITGGSHMMDASYYLIEGEGDIKDYVMAKIGATNEYKLSKSAAVVYQNRLQAVGNAHFALLNDPRRMFMFATTIECDQLRLWYFSRSHSAVSEPLNWKNKPRLFAAALLSFIFAKPAELGYDDSIKRHLATTSEEQAFYIYRVGKGGKARYFKTVNSLFENQSLNITGRTTRVWEVEEVASFDDLVRKPGTPRRVLKDVWLDSSTKTEKQIQEALFQDVDNFIQKYGEPGSPEQIAFNSLNPDIQETLHRLFEDRNYRRHFLSIDCDIVGHTSKTRHPHATPCPEIFDEPGVAIQPADIWASRFDTRDTLSPAERDTTGTPKVPRQHPRQHTTRRQYRVVFKEVAPSMQTLPKLGDAMRALKGGLFGLIIMFLAGWVHRDVSAGNILLDAPDGQVSRGIIADLEYSKKFNDAQTGTPLFIAYEIESGQRIEKQRLQYDKKAPIIVKAPATRTVEEDVPVRHNFLHDLESVWRLYLWTILGGVDYQPSQETARQLFRASARHATLSTGKIKAFSKALHPAMKGLAEGCDTTRGILYTEYQEYDHHPIQPLSGETTNRLMELCAGTITMADSLGDSVPELNNLHIQGKRYQGQDDIAPEEGQDEHQTPSRSAGQSIPRHDSGQAHSKVRRKGG
ncbi:hypothetical protein NLJ89_g193 [Agrocybe chaxingu]|uniref:Fungal-type protein kinase domain-containing protein n=1 Tax=Agrocybe chaxingu TaxID=84603 RepID=A0A9W8N295_9AGAR|nr:hypothetical protein NLJ89_g193 [Agrocybe chaxingu]